MVEDETGLAAIYLSRFIIGYLLSSSFHHPSPHKIQSHIQSWQYKTLPACCSQLDFLAQNESCLINPKHVMIFIAIHTTTNPSFFVMINQSISATVQTRCCAATKIKWHHFIEWNALFCHLFGHLPCLLLDSSFVDWTWCRQCNG